MKSNTPATDVHPLLETFVAAFNRTGFAARVRRATLELEAPNFSIKPNKPAE